MKILILANIGSYLYKLRRELIDKLIHEEYVVYISCINDEYVPKLQDLGCKYTETKLKRRGKNLISDITFIFNYIKTISKIKPDIILTYNIKPNIYGGVICRIKKIPYITNITGLGTELQNDNFFRKI